MKIAKIGLTGGMGSGKSTVAGIFRRIGIQTIDADQIARELTQPGFQEFDRIIEYFGDGIIDPSGNIDRARLGRIVFSDSLKRSMLEIYFASACQGKNAQANQTIRVSLLYSRNPVYSSKQVSTGIWTG